MHTLRAYLDQLIHTRGRIPFSEYMDAILYHPEFGYYSSARNPIGAGGDYYTSANVDPAMGRLLARLFGAMEREIGSFEVIELGAGTGLMARHILETRAFPYRILERSAAMRQRQQAALEGFDVEWVESLPEDIHGCVFSNEFFDALPVRRYVRRDGAVRELFVAAGLREVEGEPEAVVDLPLLGEGSIADIAPEAARWARRIGNALTRGYHLAIDYGCLREDFFSRPRGTLMCYRRHVADENPYADPGEKDVTAHVNFSDLIDAGREAGLDLAGYRTQKDFLIDLGLLELIRPLAEAGTADAVRRLQALKNLLLPPMMGERFKVLLQRKGVPPGDLPGFGQGA